LFAHPEIATIILIEKDIEKKKNEFVIMLVCFEISWAQFCFYVTQIKQFNSKAIIGLILMKNANK